jgi:hypothetical protein
MRVKWTEFNQEGYRIARESYPEANPRDFEHAYEGEVVDKYHTFWGTPKFVVALPDGSITTVTMRDCRIVEEAKDGIEAS